MLRDRFQIVGDNLSGHGLSFDLPWLQAAQHRDLVELVEVIYKQGRESALLPFDDRFTLSLAIDALRALAVIVGATPTGDRYRSAADIVARLLADQGADV